MIDLNTIFMLMGFFLAAYSVVSNDSLQVLGTFISSNREIAWYKLWIATSTVLVGVLSYGWYINGGDISYHRLDKIPYITIEWYHALAPLILVVLTQKGIPVSTSLLVLSVFASSVVLEKIIMKSFLGYGIAAITAYFIWIGLTKLIDEKLPIKEEHKRYWIIGQWCSTGFLWATWLMHDMANIAVFLPRNLSVEYLVGVLITLVAGLGWLFYTKGGKIQEIIINKSGIRFIRSATIIDFIYFLLLYFFKELNNIPMSTTFVFIGLITGRELAIYSHFGRKFKTIFPLVAKDLGKLLLGLGISILIVFGAHALK